MPLILMDRPAYLLIRVNALKVHDFHFYKGEQVTGYYSDFLFTSLDMVAHPKRCQLLREELALPQNSVLQGMAG